jgi:hypothetical protein
MFAPIPREIVRMTVAATPGDLLELAEGKFQIIHG